MEKHEENGGELTDRDMRRMMRFIRRLEDVVRDI